MRFCPNCRTKLRLIRDTQGAITTLDYRCPECGYAGEKSPIPQRYEVTEPDTSEKAVVVIGEKEQKLRVTPTLRSECPKCHNNLAYVWQVQTRSGDEGPTQFFRCTKCDHTWRLYT